MQPLLCTFRPGINEYYHEVITKLVDDGEEKDEEWEDYQEEINAFGSYYKTTWIEKRGGRGALFKPELWNQYATVLEGAQVFPDSCIIIKSTTLMLNIWKDNITCLEHSQFKVSNNCS